MKKTKGDKKRRILAFICLGVGLFLLPLAFAPLPKTEKKENFVSLYSASNESDFLYLSDTPYIKEQSSVGYGEVVLDSNINTSYNNGLITLNIDGVKTSFIKGVLAHATSTMVYDLSNYNYDYFTSYIGVDQSVGSNGNGVKFAIYTSVDGENWDLKTEAKPPVFKGTSDAQFVKIDIQGAKYLKLYCHNNGNRDSDHAVYANAKLIKKDYVETNETVSFIKTVEEYDQMIKKMNIGETLTKEQQLTLLQRTFVNNVGYDVLQMYAQYSDEFKEIVEWLMSDYDNLNLYIMGGKPSGSYVNSLKVLVELYKNYHNDWTVTEVSKYGAVKGEVYKRMAFTLSLTHSTRVALWMQPSGATNQSDAVTRYQQFKKMYDEGKFKVTDSIDITPWFENYNIEEMRYIMNTALDDEEVLWLHDYTQSQIEAHPNSAWSYLTPHPYMAYVWPNYSNPVFHDEARKDYWDQKYNGIFSKYGVTYSSEGNMVYKVWMNFRTEFGTGAVCGGISKTGSNIRAVHGIPASVIGQPGHAAIIYYNQNSEGQGYWGIDNDVSGWTLSEKGERLPLGWGNDRRYVKGYNVPYIAMAQEALNRFDSYEKSAKFIMLADAYQSDKVKRETYLRKAIGALDFNVDAWYALIDLYVSDESKTEEQIYQLASDMSKALLEYPLPFYNLMAKIEPRMTSNAYKFKYSLLLTDTLNKAKVYEGTDVLQPALTRVEAAYLLGQTDSSLATFSFDGDDAGKIVLSERFDGSGIRWDYSIDGKQKWNEVSFTAEEAHKHPLSEQQLDSITSENDIYVHIVGVDYSEGNLYKIDIQEQDEPVVYNNDLENRVMGTDDTMEWRMPEDTTWTLFKSQEPDLTGDKTVLVRSQRHGIYLTGPELSLNFTKDIIDETKKYIPISRLSIESVSSEATAQGRYATNAIDGNINTNWHSAWNGSDSSKYIAIKFDQPIALSKLDYVPGGGGNGRILSAQILGSMDGENWTEITSSTKWANNDSLKSIEFEEPQIVRYVKVVGKNTSTAGGGSFITAKMFNFYEDTTKEIPSFVEIEYSTTKPTNQNVVAKVVSKDSEIKVLNNNGNASHEFTKNGKYTFEYEDIDGRKNSIEANVTWIDKEAPTASIEYDTTTKGTGPVVARLVPNEDHVIILNNHGSDIYTFTQNGTFEFVYQDMAGNQNKTVAKVTSIIPESQNLPTTSSTKSNKMDASTLPLPTISITNEQQNARIEYRTYSTDSVSLRIPSGTIDDTNVLKENSLELSDTLLNHVSQDSKYFEVYFEDGEKKERLTSTSIEMMFQLDSNKKLLAIYEVNDQDVLTPLSYQLVGDHQAVVEVTGLKKYILSYTDLDQSELSNSNISKDSDSSKERIETEEKDNIQILSNLHFWVIGGISILLIALGIRLLKRKTVPTEHFVRINYN